MLPISSNIGASLIAFTLIVNSLEIDSIPSLIDTVILDSPFTLSLGSIVITLSISDKSEILSIEISDSEINKSLPGYLRQIYRFFGFWVVIIGLFITSFSRPNVITIHKEISKIIIYIVGFMMAFGLYLGYSLIPSSHFISLIWILFIFYLISLFSYIKLKD